MAKKLKKYDDQQLADAVRMSSQEIWQAGLSAFAKAQEEQGKTVQWLSFEKEGHGLYYIKNKFSYFETLLKFLYRYIGHTATGGTPVH